MLTRKKPSDEEIREVCGIAQASDELSATLKEFDRQAETWARDTSARQIANV